MMKLSICIPTYNRKDMLKEAVGSVIEQIDENNRSDVEIVISDNASSDGTAEMISDIKRKNPLINLKYDLSEKNLGADNNYLRVISLASGEYCWFLGSDDKISEKSLDRVLQEISLGHTVYLSNRFDATFDNMQILRKRIFFSSEIKDDLVFEFKNQKDWDFYLNRCETLGAAFSYLSSIVFKREEWNKIHDYETYIGTAYVHVAILLQMLKEKKATLKYLREPLVLNRIENDSFKTSDYQRLMLDIDGYILLSELFDDELIKDGIRKLLKKEHPTLSWKIILRSSKRDFENLITKLPLIGYDDREIELFRILRRSKLLSFIIFGKSKLYGKYMAKNSK